MSLPSTSNSGSLGKTERQLIVTLATQTGDQAHVAAAAVLDDWTDVLVIFSRDRTNLFEAQQASLRYFQGATGTTDTSYPKRGHQICLNTHDGSRKLYNMLVTNGGQSGDKWIAPLKGGQPINSEIRAKKPEVQKIVKKIQGDFGAELESILQYTTQEYYHTLPVFSATYIVAERMAPKDNTTARVEQYWLLANRLGCGLDPQTMLQDNDFKTIPFPNGKNRVLLLWSRYTGGNTSEGYNPEGDSDPLGQKQLLLMAKTLGMFDAITIGHDPAGSLEKDRVHAKCHLGEFYLKQSIGSSRERQLSFMLALIQKYPGKLFQMGQKTGEMDPGALVGIPTL